ncbi:MAG: hypothetical protein AB4080_21950 [Trichodesmium sp.]
MRQQSGAGLGKLMSSINILDETRPHYHQISALPNIRLKGGRV